jgi:hypothetical protein
VQRYAIGLWVPAFARTTGKVARDLLESPAFERQPLLCQPAYSAHARKKGGP